MTLPNEDLSTVLKAIRALYRRARKGGMTQTGLAIDMGVSPSTISMILRYPKYRPGGYVERQLREYLQKVKQRCPESVED